MKYYFNILVKHSTFEEAVELVKSELKNEGFGILNEIDIQKTLKEKIGADFKKYRILGACNPHFAYKALQGEDKIGLMLPCNVVVEEHDDGQIEISAIDPVASMSAIKNEGLGEIAMEVQRKMKRVIEGLEK